MTRKLRRPYFVKATLLADGTVEAIDDDGEVFHLDMDRGRAWPILSRRARRFELNDSEVGEIKPAPAPPPQAPFKPRLIG